MTIEQKIKEIEGFVRDCQIMELDKALEVIRELQADNRILKARLQPTPEAPEIDKITCLEADIALRDDRIRELEKKLDRGRYKKALKQIHNMAMNSTFACCSVDEQNYAGKILELTVPIFEKQNQQGGEGV